MTQPTCLKKTSIMVSPFKNNNSALTHRQKSLCGSYGSQHHILRDPEAVPPNCASSNRHTDQFPVVDTEWPVNSPVHLGYGRGTPREQCIRQ